MPTVRVKPKTVRVGDPFTITGSGHEGTHVQVTVTYAHRAETYKAAVAQAEVPDPDDPEKRIPNPHHKAGDISLTETAEEAAWYDEASQKKVGCAVVVWDHSQRNILAETTLEVTDG